jgi:hypothetical protein
VNAARKQLEPLPAARILDVTEDEYFADPCPTPSLSQSVAHTIVKESPLHGWLQHPRLGAHREESTDALDEGTILHKLILGKGAAIAKIEFDDFRTKLAREARDEAIANGQVPIIAHKHDAILAAAEKLRGNCAALGYEFKGESEVAIEWWARGTNRPIICRSRIDHLFLDQGIAFDVKKTRNANPNYLRRNFVELGYDIQYAAYTRAIAALKPELEGRTDLIFLFMEMSPPYSVVPARPDGALREIGASRWSRAVHLWEQCFDRRQWPGYCDSLVTLEATPWVIEQELGSQG